MDIDASVFFMKEWIRHETKLCPYYCEFQWTRIQKIICKNEVPEMESQRILAKLKHG